MGSLAAKFCISSQFHGSIRLDYKRVKTTKIYNHPTPLHEQKRIKGQFLNEV